MNDSWLKRSVVLRMILAGGMSLGLLIPSVMVMGLISERESVRNGAIWEVNEKWGQAQTITGPILSVPFKKKMAQPKGEPRIVLDRVYILPESLSITTTAVPEIRYRGIYESVLYSAKLSMNGRFTLNSLASLHVKSENIVWEEARLLIGISDLKGIRESIVVRWNGKAHSSESGVPGSDVVNSGITIIPLLTAEKTEYDFSTDMNFNGSGDLQVVPVGKETTVRVASSWQSPSFVGRFLPDKRTITADGFNAEWKVLHLNRNFPQQWIDDNAVPPSDESPHTAKAAYSLASFAFGVKLLQPIDEYQKTMRSAKYAIMFVSLTFLAFFLTEVLNKKIVHPIQYALIGLALVLFYCLLLSLAEHMSFNSSYLISASAIILLVAGYARAVLASNIVALLIGGVLTTLYGFLFVILQQEDYALLCGSFGLFAILAIVMYLTRKIDWFAISRSEAML